MGPTRDWQLRGADYQKADLQTLRLDWTHCGFQLGFSPIGDFLLCSLIAAFTPWADVRRTRAILALCACEEFRRSSAGPDVLFLTMTVSNRQRAAACRLTVIGSPLRGKAGVPSNAARDASQTDIVPMAHPDRAPRAVIRCPGRPSHLHEADHFGSVAMGGNKLQSSSISWPMRRRRDATSLSHQALCSPTARG